VALPGVQELDLVEFPSGVDIADCAKDVAADELNCVGVILAFVDVIAEVAVLSFVEVLTSVVMEVRLDADDTIIPELLAIVA